MSLLCAIPFAARFLSMCASAAPLAVGYVEGEHVLLAPIEVAQVERIEVRRGDQVQTGQVVAVLESRDAEIAVALAGAALAQAKAQLADLKLGKRPEEIAALEAAVLSAEARLAEAKRVRGRVEDLQSRGIAAKAQLDEAMTGEELASAALRQAEANLAVAGLPARQEAINAAAAALEQAEASMMQAQWRLAERMLRAPSPGRISDIIRNAGDVSGPAAPVVSMLPEGAVKLKLFVPQAQFSALQIGTALSVRCDGCAPGLAARVSYVSPEPEFTPPVIYSHETRQKLVYLVEARPEGEAVQLQPGQIIDVLMMEDK